MALEAVLAAAQRPSSNEDSRTNRARSQLGGLGRSFVTLTVVNDVLKRVHILVGLFNLTAIVVFAATGIAETFPQPPASRETRMVDYQVPRGLDDRRVAE